MNEISETEINLSDDEQNNIENVPVDKEDIIMICTDNSNSDSAPDFEKLKKIIFDFTEREKDSLLISIDTENKNKLWLTDNVIL